MCPPSITSPINSNSPLIRPFTFPQVPANEHVRLTFLDAFNVTIEPYNEMCHHWAEVKLHADLAVPGPRFCGTERPEDVISEKDVMVVSFRAIHPIQKNGRGFKAVVSVGEYSFYLFIYLFI
jgi:hypothetical protein